MRTVGHHLELTRSSQRRLARKHAEEKRRIPEEIEKLEKKLEEMRERHRREYEILFSEFVRYCRAKPGTKYDIRTRKGKK
jgi:hypothetical protein